MITNSPQMTLEAFTDAIAEVLISPEFAQTLTEVHTEARRAIGLRMPEYVYTEEIEQPGGYPCCELLTVDEDADTLNVGSNDVAETSVIWTVNGDNEQVMKRELMRLIEASKRVFNLMNLQPLVGGSVWTGRISYGPVVSSRVVEGQSSRFVKSASITLFWRAIG